MIQCNYLMVQPNGGSRVIQPGAIVLKGLTALVWALLFASAGVLAKPATLNWQDLLPDPNVELGDANKGVPHWERVRADLNKKEVRIPGFIVPLEYGEERVVTRFLLVPYFGACIHEPPPAPNQTIYAEFEAGHKLESIWTPVWVEGHIHTSRVEEKLATASYTMIASKIEIY